MKRILLLLGVLAIAVPGLALSEPKTGLGLYAGYSQDDGSQTTKGGGTTSSATDYSSSGPAVGLDFQFKLGGSTSLGIFAEATLGEPVSCGGCSGGTKVDRSSLGLEFRYWFDTIFIGLRGAATASTFEVSSGGGGGSSSQSFSGSAIGVTGGWEGSSGLFFKLSYDAAQEQYKKSGLTTDDSIDSFRLMAGYRF